MDPAYQGYQGHVHLGTSARHLGSLIDDSDMVAAGATF